MPDALQDLHGTDYGHVSTFLLNHPELTHLYHQSLAKLNPTPVMTSASIQPTSDTPETATASRYITGTAGEWVPRYISEQLERQRNELNHHLHNVLEGHHGAFVGAREYLKALRAGGLGE